MMEEKIEEKIEKKFVTSSGSKFSRNVEYKFDTKLNCMVPYLGEKFNLYEQIQLSKTQVDLDNIIKRARAGDTSVLHMRNGSFADVSDIPDNLNDLNSLHATIEEQFNALSPELRNLFGNSVESFGNSVANGSYNDTINNYVNALNSRTEVKKEEVTDNV